MSKRFSAPQLAAFLLILFLTGRLFSAEPKKMLMTFVESEQTRGATALLARGFLSEDVQVIMPEEVTPSQWLQPSDLADAMKGNFLMIRKVAAFSQAGLIFSGQIKSTVSPVEALNMKMNEASVTIAYKISKTGSGKTIEIDRRAYRAVNTSQEKALNDALYKMGADLPGILMEKVHDELATHDNELGQFRKMLEKEQKASAPPSPKQRSQDPIQRVPRKEFRPPQQISPPKITLTRPVLDTKTLVLTVKHREIIEGRVEHKNPLILFRINNKDCVVDDKGFFSESIAVPTGAQEVVIEALDNAGNRAKKSFRVARESIQGKSPDKKPALWGLAVGVSEYESRAFDLKYAHKDASSFAHFMKGQEGGLFSEVFFKTLQNQEATRDTILNGISEHLGKASPEDVVFIFISGHGIRHPESGSYYFLPHDADYNSVLSKGLRMSDLDESIEILSKNVGKVVAVLDTCHSGGNEYTGVKGLGRGEDVAKALKTASGRFILAASKGGEVSLENEKYKLQETDSGHGAFTYALIKGLSGAADDGDGCVTLNEVAHYVAREVPRLTNGRQHPYFKSEGTDMPLVLLHK